MNHFIYATFIMRKPFPRRIIYFLNFLLLIICIINSCQVVDRLLHPELPSTRKSETDLKDIEFPLSFRICLHKLKDINKRYQKLGYKDVYKFFLGRSRFNNSFFGWNGHSEKGGIIASTEGYLIRKKVFLLIFFIFF